MIKRLVYLWLFMSFILTGVLHSESYNISSPDKNITVKVGIQDGIYYSVSFLDKEILKPSSISLTLRRMGKLGIKPTVKDAQRRSVNEKIHPVVRIKSEVVPDVYNELYLEFQKNYSLVFRVYNDGIAYRWITNFQEDTEVVDEEVVYNFSGNHHVYFPFEESFFTHQERLYSYQPLSQVSADKMAYPPILIDIPDGPKVVITEANLEDYAGLYLKGTGTPSLKGLFPSYPVEEEQTRDRDVRVVERADYIAKTNGKRAFPWRVMVIAKEDGLLVESQMIYRLAKPLQLKDVSWIKPGKVAWDWWNALNIYGADFQAGINTQTYKYYIDFAAKHRIEYIILDEGWYELGNLLEIKPEIDIEEIVRYSGEKNVGVILWVVWNTLEDQLERALDQFAEWGIKGIKVDFMQRDDQWMVNYYHKIAREAAKRHLLVDFHGAYKPTGLRRAYPNVMTREGVLGLEHNKWSENASPEHNLIIPFTRMVAGPMDYTPGAMINAQKQNFKPVFRRPMSMGTRCHQLAMYIIYESPLQMLSDSPSNYYKEEECMEFLSQVPVVWDETKVLDARVADFVLMARRSGKEWYVGAMTDWTPREVLVDFSFLPPGEHEMTIYRDGVNAHRYGSDYKKETRTVTSKDTMTIQLAPGGGWAAQISPPKYKKVGIS
jgi:alpha-glucosidase